MSAHSGSSASKGAAPAGREQRVRVEHAKESNQRRDRARPSGLVAGAQVRAVVSVEILVEEKVVAVDLAVLGHMSHSPIAQFGRSSVSGVTIVRDLAPHASAPVGPRSKYPPVVIFHILSFSYDGHLSPPVEHQPQPTHRDSRPDRAAGRGPVSDRHPAIEYSARPTSDPVSDMNRRITSGDLKLKFEPTNGYLKAVLDALHVAVESQMLVYSETSVQFEHITQTTPRALYFNDSTAVGWTERAESLEVSAQDSQQGVVFYTLKQTPTEQPRFQRSQRCLVCHEAAATLGVPGMLTMSMLPMSDDPNDYAIGWAVDHRTRIEDRWGGWFVTGAAVPNRHLGNVPVYHNKIGGGRAATAPVLTSARVSSTPRPTSRPTATLPR